MSLDYSASLEDEQEPIRLAYYGDPGTRKTTMAADMARLGKIVYIDSEQGLKPSALRRQGIDVANIIPVRRPTFHQLEDLMYEWFEIVDKGNELPFVGIVADTLTALIERLVANLVGQAVKRANIKGEDRAAWKVYQDDYGDMTNQLKSLLRGWRDLPVHLVLTTHSKRDQSEDGTVRVGPSVTPSIRDSLVAYSDIIINTRVVEAAGFPKGLGYGLTDQVGRYDGKDRFGILPKNMANPTVPRIIEYVKGDLTKDEDPEQIAAIQAMRGGGETNTNTDSAESKEK